MTEELFKGPYEKRMYFFVPYNISDIQKGIQAGHAALEYAEKFRHKSEIWDFIENDKTWIILNGGTTNKSRDLDGISHGSLNQIADSLGDQGIDFAYFLEPDLNDALSAVCFIADERVFNYNKYPDWEPFMGAMEQNEDGNFNPVQLNEAGYSEEEWNRLMTDDVLFLRNLIRNKKLA